MPMYKVDIEKELQGEFWTNRYLINAETFGDAVGFSAVLVQVERNFHTTDINFTRVRTSDSAPNTDVYVTTPIGETGTRTPGSPLLPLFNTLRVELTVGIGRPSRKYYRGVLTEADVAFNSIVPASVTELSGLVDGLDTVPIVDPQMSDVIDHVVFPRVQMRQLRRGSRRRRTPVL